MTDSGKKLSDTSGPAVSGSQGRIGVYISTVESARGAEQVAALLAKGFSDKEYKVDFLVEDEVGWLVEHLRQYSPNIRVINLNEPGFIHSFEPWFRSYAVLRLMLGVFSNWPYRRIQCPLRLVRALLRKKLPIFALSSYVKASRPDAVISLLNIPNTALLLARCVRRMDTRLIISVHNTLSVSFEHTSSRWKRNLPLLMRCLCHRADAVVAVSGGVADDLKNAIGLPGSNIEVVYNPVIRPEIISLSEEAVDHPWLIEKSCPVLVAASKLKPQKDLQMLLRAFALVRKKRRVRLIILGEGPEREALQQLASELSIAGDIDLAGFIQNPFAFYSRADLFVMSSAWEGLPTALIEAMGCGCPVVSTDCPSGPQEILEGGRYGTLVPVGDQQAMAEAIEANLDSPPLRAQLLERAACFSVDKSIDHYEALVRKAG